MGTFWVEELRVDGQGHGARGVSGTSDPAAYSRRPLMIGMAQSLSPERVDVDEASSINGLIIALHIHAVKKEQSLAMPGQSLSVQHILGALHWVRCHASS